MACDNYHPLVDYPSSNTARTAHQLRNLNQRSKSGPQSRSQPSKPTLLLRGGLGWQSSDRRCRGCVRILGRPGGRIRYSNWNGGTPDGSRDVSDQVLYPLLCGRSSMPRISCSRRVSRVPNSGDATVFSDNFSCVTRDNPRRLC